ncbi:signal transduction protein PmrD [Intestinirhabdus alba]|jgi:signal transduction protein PmrD|uniref:Signal transduction protein PmrD n=1 Tax=Intestinirhabdus alba TaxID=2899544 RepID=A0A6L6IL38_9ENTR|nr:signal transduction protein PmrD [Intestinirhabdus alba]MTH46438.1 signal transduction protein PmrD [Intestinirhabdus alba]
MEWLVKKTLYLEKSTRQFLVLWDSGGSLKMIAEVLSVRLLQVGDVLSPMPDALYCINRDRSWTVKMISAGYYCRTEWERLAACDE